MGDIKMVEYWPLTTTNSHIRDLVTPEDFVPLGVTVEQIGSKLIYPPDDLQWSLKCFIYIAIGKTVDNKQVFFQGRLPFTRENRDVVYIDGTWCSPYTLRAPLYYVNDPSIYPYPTVFANGTTTDTKEMCRAQITFNPETRKWIYGVYNTDAKKTIIDISGKARSIPFWIGKMEGPYIIMGASIAKEDLNIWGGFWEMGEVNNGIITIGETEHHFDGHFLYDRAAHRSYYIKDFRVDRTNSSSAITIHQKEFDLMMLDAINPSPVQTPVPVQHQGRINLPTINQDYTFNNFTFTDSGGLQPTNYALSGNYDAGTVNLEGEVIDVGFLGKWKITKGVWWNPDGYRSWGRAFIHWTGIITKDIDTINVDTIGVGEFTRYNISSRISGIVTDKITALPISDVIITANGYSTITE